MLIRVVLHVLAAFAVLGVYSFCAGAMYGAFRRSSRVWLPALLVALWPVTAPLWFAVSFARLCADFGLRVGAAESPSVPIPVTPIVAERFERFAEGSGQSVDVVADAAVARFLDRQGWPRA